MICQMGKVGGPFEKRFDEELDFSLPWPPTHEGPLGRTQRPVSSVREAVSLLTVCAFSLKLWSSAGCVPAKFRGLR